MRYAFDPLRCSFSPAGWQASAPAQLRVAQRATGVSWTEPQHVLPKGQHSKAKVTRRRAARVAQQREHWPGGMPVKSIGPLQWSGAGPQCSCSGIVAITAGQAQT